MFTFISVVFLLLHEDNGCFIELRSCLRFRHSNIITIGFYNIAGTSARIQVRIKSRAIKGNMAKMWLVRLSSQFQHICHLLIFPTATPHPTTFTPGFKIKLFGFGFYLHKKEVLPFAVAFASLFRFVFTFGCRFDTQTQSRCFSWHSDEANIVFNAKWRDKWRDGESEIDRQTNTTRKRRRRRKKWRKISFYRRSPLYKLILHTNYLLFWMRHFPSSRSHTYHFNAHSTECRIRFPRKEESASV